LDVWFLQGVAAGAVGFGAGAIVGRLLGGGMAGAVFGTTAGNMASTYTSFVMDNYVEGRDSLRKLDARQGLVLAASGAGSFLLDGMFGAVMAHTPAGADVFNDKLLDIMVGLASGLGVGAANVFGRAAEQTFEQGRRLGQERLRELGLD
jgi:hypothetical protein